MSTDTDNHAASAVATHRETATNGCPALASSAAPAPRLRLILATGNAHKAAEFARLFALHKLDFAVSTAAAVGGMPEVPEDTGTFLGNARQKAVALRTVAPPDAWVMSDDSGLCCDALDGAPGVETANYAGPHAPAAAHRAKLLEALRDVPDEQRTAHYFCQLVLLPPSGGELLFEGKCHGRILRTERGAGGFGYDPIFQCDGDTRSFAEVSAEEKDRASHRGVAFAEMARALAGRMA